MQKHATNVFVVASVVFGIVGVLVALTAPGEGTNEGPSDLNSLLVRLLMATGFVVLSSFALAVAYKYLDKK